MSSATILLCLILTAVYANVSSPRLKLSSFLQEGLQGGSCGFKGPYSKEGECKAKCTASEFQIGSVSGKQAKHYKQCLGSLLCCVPNPVVGDACSDYIRQGKCRRGGCNPPRTEEILGASGCSSSLGLVCCHITPPVIICRDHLYDQDVVKTAVKDAWDRTVKTRSKSPDFHGHEHGGWILINLQGEIKIIQADQGAPPTSESSSQAIATIALGDIALRAKFDNPHNHYRVVASFHTHPDKDYPQPSKMDKENQALRDYPGLVYNGDLEVAHLYGPPRRGYRTKGFDPPDCDLLDGYRTDEYWGAPGLELGSDNFLHPEWVSKSHFELTSLYLPPEKNY